MVPVSFAHFRSHTTSHLKCSENLTVFFTLFLIVGAQGKVPFKGIVTHGFVLDGHGRKMSKSVGNVIDPRKSVIVCSNIFLVPSFVCDS